MSKGKRRERQALSFRHFPMSGVCMDCGSFETMYVGETLIDEMCCRCGRIIGGGYCVEG